MTTPRLKVEGLRNSFGGGAALRVGRFEFESCSVHVLCDGNGAGRSTLPAIVMGIERRNGGTIWRSVRPIDDSGPTDAAKVGFVTVGKEPSPIPENGPAENIHRGRNPSGRIEVRAIDRSAPGCDQRMKGARQAAAADSELVSVDAAARRHGQDLPRTLAARQQLPTRTEAGRRIPHPSVRRLPLE